MAKPPKTKVPNAMRPLKKKGAKPVQDHGKLGLHRVDKNRYTKGGQTFKRTSKGFQKLPKPRPRPKAPQPGDDPLQPLTGKSMRRETESATKLKYGPSEQEIGSQRRISDQQSMNVGSWYDDYINKIQGAASGVAAQYGQAQQNVYNQANTARTQDDAQAQRLSQEAQASAAQRGTTATESSGMAQAAAARQSLSSSFGGLIGAQGANAAQAMGARYVSGGQHKLRALHDERQRRAKVDKAGSDLQAEKGQFKVDYMGKLREGERTYALNSKAYGLKVQTEENRAAQARAKAKADAKALALLDKDRTRRHELGMTKAQAQQMQSDRRFRFDQEKFGFDRAVKKYQQAHGLGPFNPGAGGKKGGPTKAERRGARDVYDQTSALLRQSQIAKENRKPGRGQYLVDLMLKTLDGSPPEPVVRAAVENYVYKGVLPKTRRRAAARGLGKVPKAKPKKKGGGGSYGQQQPPPTP